VVHNAFVLSGINTFFYDVANGLMLILAVLFSWYIERKNAKGMLAVKQRKLEQAARAADGKDAAFERA
jgi:ribose transport system permease protein